MLTIQILLKNNQETIEQTLESIKEIDSKIIVADIGCSDDSIKICKNYTKEIIKIKEKDYSKIRNQLSGDSLNFYINPWEVLLQGQEIINELKEITDVYVFNNNIISKETRIWTSEKFVNPIYETLINKNKNLNSGVILSSRTIEDNIDDKIILIKNWMKENPISADPYYYLSCCYLSKKDFNKFFFYANEYIVREKKVNLSLIMIKYYMSQVNLYLGNMKSAAELALFCLSYHPTFAEFWCLLGDIYYKQNKLKKSKSFYENALIIGQKRKNDSFPIEINKYKEYPEKMIKNIEETNSKTEIFSN